MPFRRWKKSQMQNNLKDKTILIGITGGIAAYKICELIRMYKKAGANVKVVMTKNALNFVTKLTLETLSDNKVFVENFETQEREYSPEHISLCDEADIMVIAPASANTISKIATGICDNLLTSVVCAFNKPVIIAPAMNTNMWNNKIIQKNISILKENNYHILEPETGELACKTKGKGRLCDLNLIFEETSEILGVNAGGSGKLKGKKVLITAGGTIEKIDTVRYISNFSSGKMGIALADEAYKQGADVTLIITKPVETPYKTVCVQSAEDMEREVLKSGLKSDLVIMAAAVADFRAATVSKQKIKKTSSDTMTLNLVKNPDILKNLCEQKKKTKNKKTVIVGFCAESENLLKNAKEKIAKKGCDYLIANDISKKDSGFSSDYNEVYILDKNGKKSHIERNLKTVIAQKILEKVFE